VCTVSAVHPCEHCSEGVLTPLQLPGGCQHAALFVEQPSQLGIDRGILMLTELAHLRKYQVSPYPLSLPVAAARKNSSRSSAPVFFLSSLHLLRRAGTPLFACAVSRCSFCSRYIWRSGFCVPDHVIGIGQSPACSTHASQEIRDEGYKLDARKGRSEHEQGTDQAAVEWAACELVEAPSLPLTSNESGSGGGGAPAPAQACPSHSSLSRARPLSTLRGRQNPRIHSRWGALTSWVRAGWQRAPLLHTWAGTATSMVRDGHCCAVGGADELRVRRCRSSALLHLELPNAQELIKRARARAEGALASSGTSLPVVELGAEDPARGGVPLRNGPRVRR